jgi:GNAT superfamily N-acetyltransferase
MAEPERLGDISGEMWAELIAGEHEPWGAVGEGLHWSEKPLNVGLRESGGRLLAAGGLVIARLRAGESSLEVVGLGGVIVTRSARGRGLARTLVAALLEAAAELGPERAMLFCLPRLLAFYASFGFIPIDAPVRAEQPGGRIEVPLCAMWKALRGEPAWPPGDIELAGEPF